MPIDFNDPAYQAMIRRALGMDPNAGAPGAGMTPADQSAYYTNLAHGTAPYVQGSADLRAQGEASGASAAERIRQQLIDFGIIPEGFQDKYGWVNDETRQLAAANTASGVSTFARLQKAYADAARRSKRALAARGMLRSGELGYQQQEQGLLHRQNLADATGKLLGANRGVYDDYTNDFNARAQQWRTLEQDAYGNVKDAPLPIAPGQQPAELGAAWNALPYSPVITQNPLPGGRRVPV